MKIINKETYSKDYRPKVIYGKVLLKYYPERLRDTARDKPDLVIPYVRSYTSKPTTLTIDDNGKIPTNKLYNSCVFRILKELYPNKKHKMFAWIDSFKVIHECGKVNYNFDQDIH